MAISRKVLLNYKKDGKRVLSIKELYEDEVAPKEAKFSRFSFNSSNTVVCPFHNDNDPSFGILKGTDGRERYHCFGCGVTGDFLDFYKHIQKVFYNKVLSDEKALVAIASRWGISLEELSVQGEEVEKTRESLLEESKNKYNFNDLKDDFLEGRLEGKPLAYFNLKLLEYIDS